jgi:hypothetical protein
VAVGETTWVPDVAFAPLQALEAVQLVELVLLQVRVEEAPEAMEVGAADRLAVGGLALVVTLRLGELKALWLEALSVDLTW